MPVQTGITKIFYNPEAANWAARKWAIYLRSIQKTELDIMLTTTSMKSRDPSAIDNAVVVRNVRSTVRRRYPGGPSISVPARQRSVVVGPSAKLQAYPGRPIYLERRKDGATFNPNDASVPMDVLQITLWGQFSGFYTFCQQHAKIGFILRTNAGRPIFIKVPAAP